MRRSNKNVVKVEGAAERTILKEEDEMIEIKEFIRRKQLQNKVLKEIADKLLESGLDDLRQSNTAS